MIIYSKSFPGGNYRFDGPDDALYARSESRWIDSELFLSWMKKVFLRHCGSQRPIILFVDGHVSHNTLNVIDLARENDVILFCLPPHTTHALQPLDVSVFRSLKSNFSKVVHALSFAKKYFVVSKREFARVVKVPFEIAFSIPNIKAGFAKCGIYPYNPKAIDQSKVAPSLTCSSLSLDDSSASSDVPSNSSFDTSASVTVPNSDDSSLPSVNPSPIVSSLSSPHNLDGCSSPQVSSESFVQTSTPVLSTPQDQIATPQASCSIPQEQSTTPSS